MTIAVKVAATALSLAVVTGGALVAGLVLLVHTQERKITGQAGEWDE